MHGGRRWLGRFHVAWPFVVGAGVTSTAFGFLYGECFGPTGIVPVLWLRPLSEPLTLLAVAVARRRRAAGGRIRDRHGQPVA